MAILTQKTVKIIGIAAVAIIGLGGGVLVGQPMVSSIQTQSEELVSVQDQVTAMETNNIALEKSKTDYPTVKRINEQLVTQFPELAQVPELLDIITAGAISSGISPNNISSITFADPEVSVPQVVAAPSAETTTEEEAAAAPVDTTASAGEFATLEIGINITGSARQLESFLNYLNNMDRAFIVNGFSVTTNQDGVSELSLTGDVFIYKAIPTPESASAPQDAVPGTEEENSPVEVDAGENP